MCVCVFYVKCNTRILRHIHRPSILFPCLLSLLVRTRVYVYPKKKPRMESMGTGPAARPGGLCKDWVADLLTSLHVTVSTSDPCAIQFNFCNARQPIYLLRREPYTGTHTLVRIDADTPPHFENTAYQFNTVELDFSDGGQLTFYGPHGTEYVPLLYTPEPVSPRPAPDLQKYLRKVARNGCLTASSNLDRLEFREPMNVQGPSGDTITVEALMLVLKPNFSENTHAIWSMTRYMVPRTYQEFKAPVGLETIPFQWTASFPTKPKPLTPGTKIYSDDV